MQLLFNKQALNAQGDERAYTLLRSIFPNTPDQILHNIVDAYVTLQHLVVAGAKYLYVCEDARSCLKDYLQHPTAEGFSARKNPNSQSIEDYFYKLLRIMPEIRGTLSNHHSDLSTRELQRALMFVESCFTLALRSRTR